MKKVSRIKNQPAGIFTIVPPAKFISLVKNIYYPTPQPGNTYTGYGALR